ncbi:MAG: EamA family transporter [Candidatus Bathyarchaeia archaeon]
MIGAVLALLAASTSAFSVVTVRRNSAGSNSFNMSLIITSVGLAVLWPLAFALMWQEHINLEGTLLFALSGSLSPGIVRLFYYKGLRKLGASTNSAVFSVYPLYSALLAVVLLAETLSGQNWLGIVCIAFGVIFLQYCSRNGNGCQERKTLRDWVFPIMGGMAIAVGSVIGKFALNLSDAPTFGVAVAYTFSLLPYVLILLASRQTRSELNLKRDLRFFWVAGIGQAVCWVFTYAAFHFDQVAVANPLISTEPVFVVLFGYFMLRQIEHVSKKVAASILLTVIGVALIAL